MSISIDRARRHVVEQTQRLVKNKERSFWPRFLFHSTHVTNAVDIVRRGSLSCRNNAPAFFDVANQGALAAYDGSHDNARFYFRPKNGYHIKTEGIKTSIDPYRPEFQMSVPVCFAFLFEKLIVKENALFSLGNVQRSHEFLQGSVNFDRLDFDAIYHDSATNTDNGTYIRDRRMAEVAIPQGVDLTGNLHSIIFRTKWDLEVFRYHLKIHNAECSYPVAVEQIHRSLFMHWGMYVSDISFVDRTLSIQINMPYNAASQDNGYHIQVYQIIDGKVAHSYDSRYVFQSREIRIKGFAPESRSLWRINIEGVLAFEGNLNHVKSQVF